MSATWTQEQILALAPDASSAKNGKTLATSRKWSSLGCNEKAAWGEFQGSGKNPYLTRIDLTEPAFKCTCPSRKFPC
ncbi:MAG: SWIM zinc finger family protein, partial [Cyanobacteria bacterium P01_C01_bin.38]